MQQQQSSHTTLQYLQQLNAKSIIPWQPVSTEGMSGPKRILEVRALPHLQGLQRAEKTLKLSARSPRFACIVETVPLHCSATFATTGSRDQNSLIQDTRHVRTETHP